MIDQERCAHINPIDASYVCMHKYMFLLLSIIFRYCTILYYQFDGAPCYFFATIVIRWKFHETILHWSCTDFLLGDKIVKIRRWWAPPKLFGVQNVAYHRRVRLQYASNTPQYPIRPQYVGVIVLNDFYCSSNYLQSDRHTIYIEAIFVIVPVVFKDCCVHTNQFPFHLCRLVLFQPSAA